MTRLVRKSLIAVSLLLITTTAGWFCHRIYARALERNCLEDAADCIEQRDFHKATLYLRRALELNHNNVDAATKMAELLEAQGMAGAIDWRIRAAELRPHEASLRFDWAQAALKARDSGAAAKALQGLEESARDTALYHKLAGALDWSLGHSDEAEAHYAKALQLDPTNQAIAFNLATIRLRSTNSATSDEARLSMERMMTNSALRMTALRQLLIFENLRQSPSNALKYSRFIVKEPTATYADELQHLELLLQVRSAEYDSWLANLKQAATNSGTRAFVLGRWLAKVNGLDDSLAWINTLPDEVQNSPPLAFLVADCQVLRRDWQALLEGIESQNWGEADPQRMALIALAQRSLGQEAAFQTAWRDTVREADHHRDSLLRLAQFASRWGWNGQRAEVVERIAAEFPDEKLVADPIPDKPVTPAQDAAAALIDAHL